MPIYAYRCESCGFEQDVLQKMSDAPLSTCPSCGQASFRKQLTAAGFQLKGSGWYVTDFRDKGGKGGASAKPADAKGVDAGGAKPADSGGAKPADSGGAKPADSGAASGPAPAAASPGAGGSGGSGDKAA